MIDPDTGLKVFITPSAHRDAISYRLKHLFSEEAVTGFVNNSRGELTCQLFGAFSNAVDRADISQNAVFRGRMEQAFTRSDEGVPELVFRVHLDMIFICAVKRDTGKLVVLSLVGVEQADKASTAKPARRRVWRSPWGLLHHSQRNLRNA